MEVPKPTTQVRRSARLSARQKTSADDQVIVRNRTGILGHPPEGHVTEGDIGPNDIVMKTETDSDIKFDTDSTSVSTMETCSACCERDNDVDKKVEVKIEPLDNPVVAEEINSPVITDPAHLPEGGSLATSIQPGLSSEREQVNLSENRPFACDQRNKQHNQKDSLMFHKRIAKSFKCNECQKSFNQKWNLVEHMRVHSGERPFQCPHCSKSFSQGRNLKRHICGVHLKLRPFKCSQCEKSFAENETLEKHTRIHLNMKSFECVFCEQSFRHSYTHRIHVRRHIRELPYSCENCNKSFATNSALIQHCHSHLEELGFHCSHCAAKFRYRHLMNFHLRTKHKVENVGTGMRYICSFCRKEFPTKLSMEGHIQRKIKENPYSCSKYVQSFFTVGDLKRHTRTVHRNKKDNDSFQKTFPISNHVHVRRSRGWMKIDDALPSSYFKYHF